MWQTSCHITVRAAVGESTGNINFRRLSVSGWTPDGLRRPAFVPVRRV